MTQAQWLQLVGGIFEFIGVLTVAWGISQTRRAFTNRPSMAAQAWAAVGQLVSRMRRKPPQAVTGSGSMSVGALISKGRGRAKLGAWDNVDVEERVERVKEQFGRLEDELDGIHQRMDQEEDQRKQADQRLDEEDANIRRAVDESIRNVAAGGLRRETIGVVLLVIGIGLATWGNLIA